MLRFKLIDMEFRKEKFDKTIIKVVGEYISRKDFFDNQSSMISVIKEDINIENIIMGQKYSRNFTWENSFDSLMQVYDSCIE